MSRIDEANVHQQSWFRGIITACHAVDPGSIPGGCTFLSAYETLPPMSLFLVTPCIWRERERDRTHALVLTGCTVV